MVLINAYLMSFWALIHIPDIIDAQFPRERLPAKLSKAIIGLDM